MKCIPPSEVALLATAIATELAKEKSIEELNLLRNIASQVSSTLLTIISQKIIYDKNFKKD